MPATIILSKAEADFLRSEDVAGISGYAFKYSVGDTAKILAGLPKTNEAYASFAGRLAAVATQLGVPDVMFTKPEHTADSNPAVVEPPPLSGSVEPEHSFSVSAGGSESPE